MPDPLTLIREADSEAEALRLALEPVKDIVWTPKITMPMLRKRVALVLAAVRARSPRVRLTPLPRLFGMAVEGEPY